MPLLIFGSIVASFVVGVIIYKIIMSKPITLEHILYWYGIVAGIMVLGTFILCAIEDSRIPGFYLCARKLSPWLTFIAAHTLMLLVFIDRDKRPLSVWASLLSTVLVLGAAMFYLLPEDIFLSPAIALLTVPLMAIIEKYGHASKTNKQSACPDTDTAQEDSAAG